MSIVIEGLRLPEKVRQMDMKKKIEATQTKHKGKRVSQMTKLDQDEMLEVMAQVLGIADENGIVR